MNLYLLSLLIYSLMILPVSVHFRVRLGRRSGYRVEFRRQGCPCAAPARRETRTAKRPFPGRRGCGSCFPQTRRFCAP